MRALTPQLPSLSSPPSRRAGSPPRHPRPAPGTATTPLHLTPSPAPGAPGQEAVRQGRASASSGRSGTAPHPSPRLCPVVGDPAPARPPSRELGTFPCDCPGTSVKALESFPTPPHSPGPLSRSLPTFLALFPIVNTGLLPGAKVSCVGASPALQPAFKALSVYPQCALQSLLLPLLSPPHLGP